MNADLRGATSDMERTAREIRRLVFQHVLARGGGYLSQGCSAAELLAALYGQLMNLGPSLSTAAPAAFDGVPGPGRPRRSGSTYNGEHASGFDRFYFSPAHYALVLYAALIATRRLESSALDLFDIDGTAMEMIGAEHSPGFELTTGSLSQALSTAGGVALARRLKGESGKVWVFMSDGEFQEGQTWEAIAALSWHRLDNVIAVIDANGQQCDGQITTVMSVEPLAARIEAFGGVVHEIDGHDLNAIINAGQTRCPEKPTFILARTDPVRGAEILRERAPMLHNVKFVDDEERARYQAFFESEYQ